MTEARSRGRFARRGRILAIRPGYNPNSSSLGVDLTLMLLGSAALAIVVTLVSTFVRLRLLGAREGASHEAGSGDAGSPEPPQSGPAAHPA